jgi:large conductance mechanosensitive channel
LRWVSAMGRACCGLEVESGMRPRGRRGGTLRVDCRGDIMSGFKKFLLRGNVVDLAVAVVIGAAFGSVVQALVKDLITPLIGAFGGVPDFSAVVFTINTSRFLIGDFINSLLAFIVIAAVVYYFVVMPVSRLIARFTPEPPAPEPTRECPYCLSKIPVRASRCAFCTADVGDQVEQTISRLTAPEREPRI